MREPRPPIQVEPATQPFFEAAREGSLVLPYCDACSRYELPGARTCGSCTSALPEWRVASGAATIFSFVIFHRSFHPAFEAPYAVCLVELEEGPRMIAEVVGLPVDELAVGIDVRVVFDPGGGDRTIPLRFQPAGRSTGAKPTTMEVSA